MHLSTLSTWWMPVASMVKSKYKRKRNMEIGHEYIWRSGCVSCTRPDIPSNVRWTGTFRVQNSQEVPSALPTEGYQAECTATYYMICVLLCHLFFDGRPYCLQSHKVNEILILSVGMLLLVVRHLPRMHRACLRPRYLTQPQQCWPTWPKLAK